MPGAVRVKLEAAILTHRRAHRSLYYDLLRDDPRFSQWIGSHLGSRGEKRLDRIIAELRRNQPKRTRDMVDPLSALPLKPKEGDGEVCETDGIREPPGPSLLRGGTGAMRYSELQETLHLQRVSCERAIQDCSNGDAYEGDRLTKLSRELRAIVRDSEALAKSFHANMNSGAFLNRIFERLASEHPHDPQKSRVLCDDIHAMFDECGGPAPSEPGL